MNNSPFFSHSLFCLLDFLSVPFSLVLMAITFFHFIFRLAENKTQLDREGEEKHQTRNFN